MDINSSISSQFLKHLEKTRKILLFVTNKKNKLSLQDNKRVAEYFVNVVNQGRNADFSKWDEIVNPNYSSGDNPPSMTQNVKTGRDEFRKRIESVNKACPDLKYDIKSIIAEGDEVMVHHYVTVTNKGGLWGLPPSDKQSKILGFHRFKFKHGQIIKLWLVFDTYQLLKDWGQALLKNGSEYEVKKYLGKLVEAGLLPSNMAFNK